MKTTNQNSQTCDIAVIGAGLTGLTTAFLLREKGRDVQVLERENRIGGQIRTHLTADFVMESGPNTGVVSCAEVPELFDKLAGACEMQTARETSKRRLIWKDGRFRTLPSGPISGMSTSLVTFADKLRLFAEPWCPKGTDPDETVGQLTERRLGRTFLRYAVDPFISGVYAGDPMRLVTRYALPKLYNLEQNYGSFIRGAVAKRKEPKSERDLRATKKVFSVRGGLGRLIDAMEQSIGHDRITLSATDMTIVPAADRWTITWRAPDGATHILTCRRVVTTCPSYALPALLPFVDSRLAADLDNLYYAPIVQASVGIRNTAGVRFAAFGGLVPSCEHQQVLGILSPSACFDGRAPDQGAVLSFFMGGVRHPDYVTKTDDQLTAIVDDALHRMLGLPPDVQPDTLKIFRHPHAIPQYEASSGTRLAAIDTLQRRYPGLILAGNIKGGIGMADRIRQATELAEQL